MIIEKIDLSEADRYVSCKECGDTLNEFAIEIKFIEEQSFFLCFDDAIELAEKLNEITEIP